MAAAAAAGQQARAAAPTDGYDAGVGGDRGDADWLMPRKELESDWWMQNRWQKKKKKK